MDCRTAKRSRIALSAQLAAQGTDIPAYVQREFEAYLKCGPLEQGFLRVRYGSGGCVELLHCGVSLFPKATLPVVLGGRIKMFRFGSKIRSRIQS